MHHACARTCRHRPRYRLFPHRSIPAESTTAKTAIEMIRKRMMTAARTAMARWRPRPPGGRIKREDCPRTKHDSLFSDWKVLIGPSDWEDYSLRKDGVEKYRIHNLPANCSFPGLYELGVAVTSANNDDRLNDKIVAVYLGHSINVRTRLQYYGRAGSHLDHGSPTTIRKSGESYCLWSEPRFFSEMFSKSYPVVYQWALKLHNGLGKILSLHIGQSENARTKFQDLGHAGSHLDHKCVSTMTNVSKRSCLQKGARVLNDVFSKGGSIVYRWAPMSCKNQAEKMEAQLLELFDYAWNKRRNGVCRHEDILLTLENKSSSLISATLDKLQSWKYTFFHKKSGNKSCEDSSHDKVESINNNQICEMAISNGYICTEKPYDGMKRCIEHKGRKITGAKSSQRQVRVLDDKLSLSNAFYGDGSAPVDKSNFEKLGSETNEAHLCKVVPSSMESTLCKAKSSLHRDMCLYNEGEHDICGIVLNDGSVCSNRPVPGRKRCILHKWQRIKAVKYVCNEEEHDICGIILNNGSICSNRPLPGRKRCITHKWQRIQAPKYISNEKEHDACGIILSDGSVCSNRPVAGRKRCILHKWQRIQMPKMCNEGEHGACGIILSDGSMCSNRPVAGRKRCIMHKWQRIQAPKYISNEEEQDICGIIFSDGSVCSNRPVPGRKRCIMHKWQRIQAPKYISNEEEHDICGIIFSDGSVCSNRPVPGRKRCIMHKWQMIQAPKNISNEEEHDICGIIFSDGSVCSNRPVPGRKRCILHKWQRIK